MVTLEILSIAIINYFTSSPEIFRPSNVQLNQVKTVLTLMHANLQTAIEVIVSKLPPELLNNAAATKLK